MGGVGDVVRAAAELHLVFVAGGAEVGLGFAEEAGVGWVVGVVAVGAAGLGVFDAGGGLRLGDAAREVAGEALAGGVTRAGDAFAWELVGHVAGAAHAVVAWGEAGAVLRIGELDLEVVQRAGDGGFARVAGGAGLAVLGAEGEQVGLRLGVVDLVAGEAQQLAIGAGGGAPGGDDGALGVVEFRALAVLGEDALAVREKFVFVADEAQVVALLVEHEEGFVSGLVDGVAGGAGELVGVGPREGAGVEEGLGDGFFHAAEGVHAGGDAALELAVAGEAQVGQGVFEELALAHVVGIVALEAARLRMFHGGARVAGRQAVLGVAGDAATVGVERRGDEVAGVAVGEVAGAARPALGDGLAGAVLFVGAGFAQVVGGCPWRSGPDGSVGRGRYRRACRRACGAGASRACGTTCR